MPRVVLDTNVLVSAALSKRGASAKLLTLLADGRFELVLSVPMVLEYEEVLLRLAGPSTWTPADVATVLDFICQVGRPLQRRFSYRPMLRDADDEFVLELAIAGGVDYLVTNNVRDFVGSGSHDVAILTPGQFLHRLERDQ